MSTRRESRELALQFLYQRDINSKYPQPILKDLEVFWNTQEDAKKSGRPFAEELIQGVIQHLEDVDARIKACSQNWDFLRIAVVDRNILRLAIYEMFFRPDIPPVVSINEAIELAKKFSTEESGAFVNGILDRVKLDLTRSLRAPTKN